MSAQGDSGERRLEQLVDQALQELPACRAPSGLEARVLAEMERRAGQPDRAAGIALWPTAARALLIVGCTLSVALVWLLVPRLYQQMMHVLRASAVAHSVNGVTVTTRMFVGLAELAVRLARMVPTDWLLGSLLVIGAAYAALIALGYFLLSPHSKVHSA